MRHCCVVSARWIYFKLEAVFLRFLCPSLPFLQKKRITWKQTFQSKRRGLLGDITCEDLNRTKSSVSIAGLCFTFSYPWRFKLTTLAFSISFDFLNLGSEDSFRPLFGGGAFISQFASGLCVKPSKNRIQLARRYMF